jgi:hypothetical protein
MISLDTQAELAVINNSGLVIDKPFWLYSVRIDNFPYGGVYHFANTVFPHMDGIYLTSGQYMLYDYFTKVGGGWFFWTTGAYWYSSLQLGGYGTAYWYKTSDNHNPVGLYTPYGTAYGTPTLSYSVVGCITFYNGFSINDTIKLSLYGNIDKTRTMLFKHPIYMSKALYVGFNLTGMNLTIGYKLAS